MRVGVAELLILLGALAAFGAAAAFGTVVLARSRARHRDDHAEGRAAVPLRPPRPGPRRTGAGQK